MGKPSEQIERVAIRFCGDSGDGIQLTGTKFTESTALAGNDFAGIATTTDYNFTIEAVLPTITNATVATDNSYIEITRRRLPAGSSYLAVSAPARCSRSFER